MEKKEQEQQQEEYRTCNRMSRIRRSVRKRN